MLHTVEVRLDGVVLRLSIFLGDSRLVGFVSDMLMDVASLADELCCDGLMA